MRVLFRDNKIREIKQIIIDEIVFLLRNKYNEYLECCNKVKNFKFKDEYDFWILIKDILEYIKNIKDYYFIVAFDQYNNENDINLILKEIKASLLKTKNFRLIFISSMNESDIRNLKIEKLLYNEIDNNINNGTEIFVEIKDICTDFFTGFNQEENDIFILLGKTMKVYNEIIQIKYNYVNQSLDEYIKEKRKKIKFRFFWFYEGAKNKKDLFYTDDKMIDFSDHLKKILSFVPYQKYSKNEIKKIINNIPFRAFNIENNYIITFSYPLIEQIFIDIYKELALNNSFSRLKKFSESSGAYEYLFKYAIINYIVEKTKSNDKKFFNYFNIEKNLFVKKFVLNNNEKFENIVFNKQTLDIQYDYFIEQELFCGKILDFILIHFINANPYVYGFQVSMNKSKIFNIKELGNSYEIMKILLDNYFDLNFKQENMFFGYIFNYESIKEDRYTKMLEQCEKESLKFCFFDPCNLKFLNKQGNDVININDIISPVFDKAEVKPITDRDDFVYNPLIINYSNIYLNFNHFQFNTIANIIKERRGNEYNWRIVKCSNYDEFVNSYIFRKDIFYICYNYPYIKLVFFNPYKVYNLLNNGDIEESNVDDNVEIYICEIIRNKN